MVGGVGGTALMPCGERIGQYTIECYPQLSPVLIHRRLFDAEEIPSARETVGSFAHQFTKLATRAIPHDRRTNSLWGGKCDSHPSCSIIQRQTHTESLVSSSPGARKTGESDASRNTTDHADRRARPLERRDFNTARPALVFIRLRNPCFFARRRLLGWNVRFTPLS